MTVTALTAVTAVTAVTTLQAIALLRNDAQVSGTRHADQSPFRSYGSKALSAGDWCDVGLYFNSMRNEANAVRAPRTSALLGGGLPQSEGGAPFRRDCRWM